MLRALDIVRSMNIKGPDIEHGHNSDIVGEYPEGIRGIWGKLSFEQRTTGFHSESAHSSAYVRRRGLL